MTGSGAVGTVDDDAVPLSTGAGDTVRGRSDEFRGCVLDPVGEDEVPGVAACSCGDPAHETLSATTSTTVETTHARSRCISRV